MSDLFSGHMASAVQDFRRLRRQADVERLLAGMSGRSADLLPFEEVRQKLRATAGADRQLREIPLDAIIGSVGRYHDFTRSFLPRRDSDEGRWARVLMASNDLSGLPPIEVYQLGDAYFVVDGNHRVSVARQNGAASIQAYVTPFRTRVPITPDVRPADLIIRAEQASFLEQTRLDEARPGSDLTLTEAGAYQLLREHIYVHGYYRELELDRAVSFEEAAASWYDNVYMPAVQVIRERGMLRDFPGRSETDLYLWLSEHRAELAAQLGWDISPARAADDLSARKGQGLGKVARAGEQMLEMVLPDELEPTPEPGAWRRALPEHPETWLFGDILAPVSGEPDGWEAFEQAVAIARVEGSRVLGLHVVPDVARRDSPAVAELRAEFARRCAEAGVSGSLAVDVGAVGRSIRARSRWADLVALQIKYPPGPTPIARLTSSLRAIIRGSLRPVLTVPKAALTLGRLLLAYDGTPKSDEALYMATYLAGRWRRPLTVATISEDGHTVEGARLRARAYLLDHGVADASFVSEIGPAGPTIVAVAERVGVDLIVMGGYGRDPLSDIVLGSSVEAVLRARSLPTLICQ